jgi:hypothetical protein
MTVRSRVILGLMLILAHCVGCGPKAVSLSDPPAGITVDYRHTLKDWTRSQRLYEDFETRVVAHATYYSRRLVEAYLQEYDRVYQPVPEERAALRTRQEHRFVRNECFFVSFFTGDRDWNDLALSSSTWRVYLETARGDRLRASSISNLEGKLVEQQHFFPYHDEFAEAYLICFNRFSEKRSGQGIPQPVLAPGVGNFSLVFRSPLGKLRLDWETTK